MIGMRFKKRCLGTRVVLSAEPWSMGHNVWLVWAPPNNLSILYNSHLFLPPPQHFFWLINLSKDFDLLSIDFNLRQIYF